MKFRAWDLFNGCFVYSENYEYLSEFFDLCEKLIKAENGIIYQLYTGMNDKNGKEIYEGDVLKNISQSEKYWKETGYRHIFEIKWMEGAFRFYCDRYEGTDSCEIYDISMYNLKNYKIIGNIYETPEFRKGDLSR